MTEVCRICRAASSDFGTALVLGKHRVRYYRCPECGFIQTERPYWLLEAYDEAVSSYDIGSVNRAIVNAVSCERHILASLDCNARFIDYGAGYGVFVRRMRDIGFDFYWHDTHCENIFAAGFEADVSGETRYELLTAFEVFEHLVDPVEEIANMLELSSSIMFSTEVLPSDSPGPDRWWYYFPQHGQHVSFYSPQSLAVLAKHFNVHLASDRRSMHLLTRRPEDFRTTFGRLMLTLGGTRFLRRRLRTQSLLAADFTRRSGVSYLGTTRGHLE